MATTKRRQGDTLPAEMKTYSVKLDDDSIVSVQASSLPEAIKKATSGKTGDNE